MEIPRFSVCEACEKQVPLHELRQCFQCGPPQISLLYCFHICFDCGVKNCTAPGHSTCWQAHLPRFKPNCHIPIDPIPHIFVTAVTYSEKDPHAQMRLHRQDQVAHWFTVKTLKTDNPIKPAQRLCVTDRFRQLCNPGIFDCRWSLHQYPTFVSFIGNTGMGKSTLVRAMLLMGRVFPLGRTSYGSSTQSGFLKNFTEDQEHGIDNFRSALQSKVHGPVTRSACLDDLTDPTSFGVHLYKDEAHLFTNSERRSEENGAPDTPILFADCEGFGAGVATANAERARDKFDENQDAVAPLILNSPITAPGFGSIGKEAVDLFYARFLYTISDVIVFVMSGDSKLHEEMKKLVEWAASAVHRAVNRLPYKTLIIVRNMANLHDADLYNTHTLNEKLFGSLKKLWEGSDTLMKFYLEFNENQDFDAHKIYTNKDFLRKFFSDVRVCYIPDTAKAPADEIFRQYQALRREIVEASRDSQIERSKAWMQYNVPMMSHILSRAFEHFRTSDEPFDFYKAAQNDNPCPVSVSDHIANFLRHLHSAMTSKAIEIPQDMIVVVISVDFVAWAVRTFSSGAVSEPDEIFSRELLKWCEEGFSKFSEKDQQCGYIFKNGGQCSNRRMAHKEHCDEKGNRAPGPFDESHQLPQNIIEDVKKHFKTLFTHLFKERENFLSPTPEAVVFVRENSLGLFRDYWREIKSNKSCLSCLQAVPDHVLLCGHSFCPDCVQEFGKKSPYFEYGWAMDHCALCQSSWQHGGTTFRLLPRCAGVRCLTLDGGGIRGIVELALLEKLHSMIGLDIPLREFFDLIVGTSTGGIIALGLATKDVPIRTLKEQFIKLATETFKRRREGGLLTVIDPLKITSKCFMILHIYSSMYKTSPLRQGLQTIFGEKKNLFSASPRAVRAAVISAKDNGAYRCLITNYNRPTFGDYHDFEREDEPNKEMKIWEACLATASAPYYFRKFQKSETKKNYTDGALHANFPVPYALEEIKRLWGQHSNEGSPLDLLVTVGTGIQDREISIPTALRIGGFEEICTSFHNNLDCEKKWREFKKTQIGTRGKVYRLNARIDGKYAAIDDYQRMYEIEDMVVEQIKDPTLMRNLEDLAENLIGGLFFFEPATPRRGSVGIENQEVLTGSIRCRLAQNSSQLESLLEITHGFWYTEIKDGAGIPSDVRKWRPIQAAGRFVWKRDNWFQVDFTIAPNEPFRCLQVVGVSLNRNGLEGRIKPVPISGFPVKFHRLKERAGLNR